MTSPLAIPDIQRIVCELLLEERGRDGLYNLKLVSRSWASAVEPLIWQDLSHLVSLLRYLPQDAWTEDKYACSNASFNPTRESICRGNFRLTRALVPSDWNAVYDRARYVRAFLVDKNLTAEHLEVILACPLPRLPLFPGLLHIELDCSYKWGSFYCADLYAELPHFFGMETSVTSFRGQICPLLLRVLLRSGRLRSIDASFGGQLMDDYHYRDKARCILNALGDETPPRIELQPVFDTTRSNHIPIAGSATRMAALEIPEGPPPACQSLKSLHIREGCYCVQTFSIHDLRPLRHFTLLIRCELHFGYHALTDADCDEMSTWWPQMQRLELGRSDPSAESKCTLRSFVSFAKGCPQLVSLVLHISARDIPILDPMPPPHHALQELTVGDAVILNAQGVAGFLRALFPEMNEFYYSASDNRETDEHCRRAARWRRVRHLVTGHPPDEYTSFSNFFYEGLSDIDEIV